MRKFETGATRDNEEDKFDYEGFLSPLVEERFAQYMHTHRKQADGALRDSDNWQKGIPKDAYMKSMFRHFMDVWKAHRGLSAPPLQESLCALKFNVNGMLFEELRNDDISTGASSSSGHSRSRSANVPRSGEDKQVPASLLDRAQGLFRTQATSATESKNNQVHIDCTDSSWLAGEEPWGV